MEQYPNRVFYTQDGTIIHQTGEITGTHNPHHNIESLHYIDIPFGSTNGYNVVAINPQTKELVMEPKEVPETEEQKRIRELEDALLLQAENEVGGIL